MPDGQAPALSSFAQQVQALREQRLPARVGVLLPTYNRPDLARSCVLQFAQQSRAPDVICVHQNGDADSYMWCVGDLSATPQVAWLHTRAELPQHQWYSIPLRWLIDNGCTHIFWTDQDDLYLRDHIEKGLADLQHADCSFATRGAALLTQGLAFGFNPDADLAAEPGGGLGASLCFNRRFALALLADLESDRDNCYTMDVAARVTAPKFRCKASDRRTVIRHAHEGSVMAANWLPRPVTGTP